MSVGDGALVVIAVCMVLITVGIITLTIVAYKLLKKMEEGVDTVNNQLRPAVMELKKTILSITEAFQLLNDFVSFTKKLKRRGGKER